MIDVHSILEKYPIGTKMRLADDDPGTVHEVLGYEWFADHANIIFVDGGKLNMERLELVTDVEYPAAIFQVVVPWDNGHTEEFWKFYKSEYESVKLDFDNTEEATKCQQAICMLLSRNRIYDVQAMRRKNVLHLIRSNANDNG